MSSGKGLISPRRQAQRIDLCPCTLGGKNNLDGPTMKGAEINVSRLPAVTEALLKVGNPSIRITVDAAQNVYNQPSLYAVAEGKVLEIQWGDEGG